MARKDPYRTIAVRRKILEALEPLRQSAQEGEFRLLSMNAFCEQILWDYALEKGVKAVSQDLKKTLELSIVADKQRDSSDHKGPHRPRKS